MKATKVMIQCEFDRRVGLVINDVERLKSTHHRYFNKYDDRQVWTKHINNSFAFIEKRLNELKELAKEWENADD